MWLNKKQKDGAVLPKPKLIVYIGMSKKTFLNLITTPKLAPKGPKSAKKDPNCGRIKNIKMGCTLTQSIMQFKSLTKSTF